MGRVDESGDRRSSGKLDLQEAAGWLAVSP